MKKTGFLIAVIAVLAGVASAKPVDFATARTVAANFWNTYHPADVKPVTEGDLSPMVYEDISHMHVFAVGQTGFVIVSGDDRVEPVLAYSFDSPFPKTLHATLRYWLGGYESQLAEVASSPLEGDGLAATRWNSLLSVKDTSAPAPLLNVPPLVATHWDQGAPYNRYCPYDTNYNDLTVVGCVATAMAQIIRFWRHPSCGIGEHSYVPEPRHYEGDNGWFTYTYDTQYADFAHTTYIYDHMPNYVENHLSRERDIKAVATLSYHCGVAVNMMYGTTRVGGSGAYSEDAATAFVNYFKYQPSLQRMYRDGIPDSAWRAMIDEDIAAGRPVYYTGRDNTGGHAFILDGADLHGRYHFNLGWSGSGDGYYYCNDISIGTGGAGGNATYTFNLSQSAIFRIEPIETQLDTVDYYDTVCSDATTYTFYDYEITAQNGVYYFVHLDSIYRVHLAKAQQRYIYYHPNGGSGNTVTSRYCYLNGAVLTQCSFSRENSRFVGWCPSPDGDDTIYQPSDTLKIRRNLNLYAIWEDTTLGIGNLSPLTVTVSPNPTTGDLFITVGGGQQAQLSVLDVMGRTVLSETVCDKAKISLQGLPAGAYTVQVRSADGICNRRVIKR